jgi:hypothetical protein
MQLRYQHGFEPFLHYLDCPFLLVRAFVAMSTQQKSICRVVTLGMPHHFTPR